MMPSRTGSLLGYLDVSLPARAFAVAASTSDSRAPGAVSIKTVLMVASDGWFTVSSSRSSLKDTVSRRCSDVDA
jgi:hypothetical protein